jgi:hypothetical protein
LFVAVPVQDVPRYIVQRYIAPLLDLCFIISVQCRVGDTARVLILLRNRCSQVAGSIHIDLNTVVRRHVGELFVGTDVERVVQEAVLRTVTLICREMDPHLFHRVDLSLDQRIK